MNRRRRYPNRKKADSSSSQMITCEDLIGRVTRFRSRIQCHEYDEPDPYKMCSDIGNPDSCPKRDYEVKVQKVSVSRMKGEAIYTINGDYKLSARDSWKAVKIGKVG